MFIDYNLFGMNFVNVDAVKFRRPLPDGASAINSSVSGNYVCWFLKNTLLILVLGNFSSFLFRPKEGCVELACLSVRALISQKSHS